MTSSSEFSSICCICNVKIPLKQVVSYYWTTRCKHAIVFKIISGREICVAPETTWVRTHVDKVDKRTATAATQSLTI
uniref:Chemokine interleukin-8-like domain-containing protein n=1 Tax=Cyprinus carpio TaxID=7962 RepID=A0A8C1VG10_CYPCA